MYGSELEGTLRRQALSSKPLIWAAGIRSPINNRIIKGSAALTWGCQSTKYDDGNCLLLGDFFPWGEDHFFDYRPMDTKL